MDFKNSLSVVSKIVPAITGGGAVASVLAGGAVAIAGIYAVSEILESVTTVISNCDNSLHNEHTEIYQQKMLALELSKSLTVGAVAANESILGVAGKSFVLSSPEMDKLQYALLNAQKGR